MIEIKTKTALTGVTDWVGHHPAKQKIADSTSDQGTSLACGFGPRLWCLGEVTVVFRRECLMFLSLDFCCSNVSSSYFKLF